MIGNQKVSAGRVGTEAARRAKLTKRAVDAVRYEGRTGTKCIVWDTELRGFGLRVFPSGAKRWVLGYRNAHGVSRLYTLGGYPELTPDQARTLALTKRGAIAAQGEDPVADRDAARGVVLFETLGARFIDEYAKIYKRSWKVDQQRIRDYLGGWAKRPAVEITRGDVADVHRRVGARSVGNANGIVMLVSKLYTWGEDTGVLPAGHPNPARRFKKFAVQSRDRFMTPDEVRTLFAKLAEAGENFYICAFFQLAFLLGTRKQELLSARWDYVDLPHRVLRLPASATKSKRPHTIPLPRLACEILAHLPREAGNPYVFPGAKRGQPLVNIEKAWKRARDAAGLQDVHFHDVRRTVGSWIAQRTGNLELVANVLNHRDPRTTKIYARFLPSQVRDALEDHSAAIVAATAPRDEAAPQ